MKAIYMMLSGLILSIMATFVITGIMSIDKLVKSKTNYHTALQIEEAKSKKAKTLNDSVYQEYLSERIYDRINK